MPYLYFIVFDFEALPEPIQYTPTEHLTLTSAHIPISVAINDNLTNEPTFLKHCDPETLTEFLLKNSSVDKPSSPSWFGPGIP